MRFTRLRLNGFKSFVDPTDLLIHPGLTGVVGPNGCGKSNLLEALRWVMGENRPTQMRGDGMEDVIFAGAASRPARNFAEVILSLDNSERRAPAGFNDSNELEIVRRITRDAGSAYRMNHKEVRARDVQMLFADASTGAHSPALVRQGQIAELINARPQSRRRVLEEAAGISGLYQRRHEAELKLTQTELNLTRVADVIEGLAQQMHSLARQSRQAARYREIGEELRRSEGMLLYRRWREAEEARAAAEAELAERLMAAGREERGASEATARREEFERAVPPLREAEAMAGAALQRIVLELEALSEAETRAVQAAQMLTARTVQLGRDIDRETALAHDAGETISTLAQEAQENEAASEGEAERLDAASEAAEESAEILARRESDHAALSEDVARLAARHQSADRLLVDERALLARNEALTAEARGAARAADAEAQRAAVVLTETSAVETRARAQAEAAELALAAADVARGDAAAREAEARAGRAAAEGEANALNAEAGALARMLGREASAGEHVLDRLTVTPGFERALGAALADDLRAPLAAADEGSGWVQLPDYLAPQALPAGAQPLAREVAGVSALTRRLDQIGLVADEEEGARLQSDLLPGQRLVTLDGDLWRWDGFRVSADDAPSAAALRLQQLNRLDDLKRELEETGARAQGTRQAHEVLTAALAKATEADRRAREARKDADRALADAARATGRAEAEGQMAAGKGENARLALARHEAEALSVREALRAAEAAVKSLPDLAAARADAEDVKLTVEAARMTMMSRRAALDEQRMEAETRARRRQEIARETRLWQDRAAAAAKRIGELAERRQAAATELIAAQAAPGKIAARRDELAELRAVAEASRAEAADHLSVAEGALHAAQAAEREAERRASEAREARARAEAVAEAASGAVSLAAERVREAADTGPEELLAALGVDPGGMASAEGLDLTVAKLRRQREALGAVNLRAEEDALAVTAEHDTLAGEKADLEAAIKKLRAGIASLNREGRERLLTAFEQVNMNFSNLFRHLFGGGEARLVLVESDDPLEAGLEIMCQPPSKKLSTLSLLSGGEQTLTALALIFAVFLANPAPICVLDEVDAPLDDANVTSFCDLLDEMTRRTDTKFLIITHHAVTMSRMDRLFGVTMQEPGVSQLVSVDLKRAEALVA